MLINVQINCPMFALWVQKWVCLQNTETTNICIRAYQSKMYILHFKLIQDCWADNPEHRPSFDTIKKTLQRINPNKLSPVDLMMAMVNISTISISLNNYLDKRTMPKLHLTSAHENVKWVLVSDCLQVSHQKMQLLLACSTWSNRK